jgi:hypothetical protein
MGTKFKQIKSNFQPDRVLEEEYRYFFENKETYSNSFEAGNPLYQIMINNNLPSEPGLFS